MGNVGVFPWRVAMMGRASTAKGAVVLPFPFSLSPASWHKAWSQWKREEHRGGVDWIETFLMSPAPCTFSHIGRNFNRPPPRSKKKKLSMPPLYIFAQSHNLITLNPALLFTTLKKSVKWGIRSNARKWSGMRCTGILQFNTPRR